MTRKWVMFFQSIISTIYRSSSFFSSPEIVALLHASPPAIALPPSMKPAYDTYRIYFVMAEAILPMIMTFKLPTIQTGAAW